MEAWRKLAINLFPERESFYSEPEQRVWWVLQDLHDDVIKAHESNDIDLLQRIYSYTQWCYSQKDVEPEIWDAAYLTFYEHLVEHPATYADIPQRVPPEVFEELLPEYEDRLDNKSKYPMEQPGTFEELLQKYDAVRGTNFWARRHQWKK